MAMPKFTMRQLLEAGVHYGHNSRRWNPKMAPFIFGERNNTHIIDLQQTLPRLYAALDGLKEIAANGGRILFVGTKRQAAEKIREAAELSGQFFVNHRWLGGMLTNWQTITKSIKRLAELEATLAEGEETGLTKKELLMIEREREKLERSLGGIREMGGVPEAIFVIDTNNEDIAIKEANKLGIPIFAVIDTNCDPEGIDYPIPGNDDSLRSIDLYCDLISKAILEGVKEEMSKAGITVDGKIESAQDLKDAEAKVKAEKEAKKKAEKEAKKADTKKEEAKEEKPAVKVEKKTTKRAKKEDKEAGKAAAKKSAKSSTKAKKDDDESEEKKKAAAS